nr:hypothetical protein [uncultured Oscillibacter sp.]
MKAVEIVAALLLIAAPLLLQQYRDSMVLPVMGLICLVSGVLLARWSRVNRRK